MAHQKPKATPTQQTIQRASIEWRIWLSASKSACGAYGGSLARYVEERCAVSPSPVGVRVDYLTPFCHRGLFCPLLVSGLVFGTSWCLRCVTQSPVCVVQRSSRCFGFGTDSSDTKCRLYPSVGPHGRSSPSPGRVLSTLDPTTSA